MPKYLVSMLSYQDIVIEAESEEEARDIAYYHTSTEDWGPYEAGDLFIDELPPEKKEEVK